MQAFGKPVSENPVFEDAVLGSSVAGRHLRPGTLADQIGPEPTLLVFLRHFG